MLGLGVGVGVGTKEGVAEGVGFNFDIKPVVALKVKYPTIPRAIIIRSPAKNDFIWPILYATLSR